jgi:HAD superfamily hydrolase (TIGR01549 family)
MAHLGSLIERGLDHRAVWSEIGVEPPAVRERMHAADLYPDALPCLRRAQDCGFLIGIAGNQPEEAVDELAALAFECDFIASSGGWKVEKPSPFFFERVIAAAGTDAGSILYVGDRLDNDVVPARRAGMHAAHLMRGPWAHITTAQSPVVAADLHLRSLAQLQSLLD